MQNPNFKINEGTILKIIYEEKGKIIYNFDFLNNQNLPVAIVTIMGCPNEKGLFLDKLLSIN